MLAKFAIALSALAASAALGAAAVAAPIQNATHVDFNVEGGPAYLSIVAWYSGPPVFDPWHYSQPLADLGCPFVPHESRTEAMTSSLALSENGWVTPVPDAGPLNLQWALHMHLSGTVLDAAGNSYSVAGNFYDDGSRHVLPAQYLYGLGHVTLSGASGVVTGEAILYGWNDGPPGWVIGFTTVTNCTV